MKKAWKAVLVFSAAAATVLAAGCGGSSNKNQAAAGSNPQKVIRVGAETTFPPFEFTQDDKYVGFDVDLTDAVIKQMGGKMEYKSMGFDALIPALQSGQIDLAVSGMDATPERAKQVTFSDPYFDKNGYVIVVKNDNDTIHDWDDIKGKTVAAQVGTQDAIKAQDAGAGEVKQLNSFTDLLVAVKSGAVDAAVFDEPVALYYINNQGAGKDVKIVGTPDKGNPFAMAMKKDNTELESAVNKALKEIKENGTYDKIYQKWFGNAEEAK